MCSRICNLNNTQDGKVDAVKDDHRSGHGDTLDTQESRMVSLFNDVVTRLLHTMKIFCGFGGSFQVLMTWRIVQNAEQITLLIYYDEDDSAVAHKVKWRNEHDVDQWLVCLDLL